MVIISLDVSGLATFVERGCADKNADTAFEKPLSASEVSQVLHSVQKNPMTM